MSNRTIEAILRLSAKLGSMGAFSQMSSKLNHVNQKALAFNRTQTMMARTSALAMNAVRGVIGYQVVRGAGALVTNFAGAERRLNRIAINADAGKDKLAEMFRTVDRAALDYSMTQDGITDGLEALVASGRSVDEALSFLPSVAATAQAAGAEIADIATTADAIGSSFKFTGDNMQRAFDILVTSGKQGKFELKDMAQYLPSLAPAMAALGYEGEKGLGKLASMLQTVRLQTGDASSAATNLQNVLQKMESNETAKSFSKFGINLRKEMAEARKEGRDLLDVFIELTERALKGDLSKIPQLFTDAQFMQGMRALLQGRDAMEGFQKALENVDGATMRDLGRVLADNQSKIDRMAASWERMKRSIGSGIAGPATGAMDFVSSNMDKAQFINAQLDKEGMGWWEKRMWWARNGFDNRDQGLKAFQGGWRSPEGLIAAKGPMSASPELPSRRQDQPGRIPLPTPRPVAPSMAEQYQLYGRGHAAAVRNSVKVEKPAGYFGNEIDFSAMERATDAAAADLKGAGVETASSVADGGKQAGDSIKSGADTLASVAGKLEAAIVSGANSLAAAARSAAADLSRPIGSLKQVRADTGRSDAGRAMGPR
ncbi:MAG: phage tail tape measure protein [Mesorhizobium sp.]|uniref:phage tail tape measure protein n=1 Tax=Mesorhizobium sp. TaxID=1871066 RepID=UPI000FE5D832|nr:phage tail tape measure protein [Mesorhizobium sp.]RWK61787.1 MAG: phage tail tape measure protein [Mesorhizobium sp.]RWM47694.1 MAG: phage tail tape measure protein [Mesorhizobium sp.]RWN02426.1 MAG: phage tail tape measure protein [Mesorhizobium sp.]